MGIEVIDGGHKIRNENAVEAPGHETNVFRRATEIGAVKAGGHSHIGASTVIEHTREAIDDDLRVRGRCRCWNRHSQCNGCHCHHRMNGLHDDLPPCCGAGCPGARGGMPRAGRIVRNRHSDAMDEDDEGAASGDPTCAPAYSWLPGAGLNLIPRKAIPLGFEEEASTIIAVQMTLIEVAAMAAVPC